MNKIQLKNNKSIYNFCEPYIIAEIGSNHNGQMDLAKKLIESAKEAGADAVKFQSWTKDSIFSKKTYEENYFLSDDYRDRNDYTLEEIVDAYSISEKELYEMKKFADSIEIDCISTPFSKKEVDFLVDVLDAPMVKVASMDVNNYPFLDYIARKKRPVIISTGLSELHEIDRAIRTIENAGNDQIIILHCVSIYPPDDNQVNLKNIDTLQTAYPEYPIGFSDHTLGTCIPLASVAKGVCMIEKHFTLDKNMPGWDHKVSATPEELKTIAEGAKRIHKAMGSSRVKVIENTDRINSFRRSIVTTREIQPGEIINEKDLDFKRPGSGIAPEFFRIVLGRKVKNKLEADKPFHLTDLV